MPKFPLIGPSYTSQSLNADCQSTINLYPESIESGAGNNDIVLYPTPGLKSFVDLTPAAPPSPPANPPVFGSFSTVIYTGTSAGNSRTNVPFSTSEILPGDLVFFTVIGQLSVGNSFPVVGVSEVVTGATYSMIAGSGVTYDAAFEAPPNLGKQLYVFWGTATNHVALGNYTMTITWAGNNTNADATGCFFPVRFLTTLHASAANTDHVDIGDTSFSGSPITTTVYTGIINVINGAHPTTVTAPFLERISGPGNLFPIATYTVGGNSQAPPGIYTPTWNNFAGVDTREARIITAAFVNTP